MEVRTAKIAQKEKQLLQLEETMLNLSDRTAKVSRDLKLQNEMDRSGRLAGVRRKTHSLTEQMDAVLRAPDKSNNSRDYSKMDLDVWKYEDVREWFNKYSTDEDSNAYKLRPHDTGYTIRIK